MENQKNLILAVVFSIIVLLGFDLFFPKQKIDPSTQTNKVIEKQSINQEDLEPSIESRIQTKKKGTKWFSGITIWSLRTQIKSKIKSMRVLCQISRNRILKIVSER